MQGEVIVCREGSSIPVATRALDDEGRFSVELPPALYTVFLCAVDHAPTSYRALVTETLEVSGRLGTFAGPADADDAIPVEGELHDAEGHVLAAAPPRAARIGPGRYRLDLSDRPESATVLQYQLRGAGGETFNGPVADRCRLDVTGAYCSVVELGDRDALDLDLTQRPSMAIEPRLVWSGDPYPDGLVSPHGRPDDADGRERDLRRAARMCAAGTATFGPDRRDALHRRVAWLVEHVAADDLRIDLLAGLDELLFDALSDADASAASRIEGWLQRMLDDNPSPSAALGAIALLLHTAGRRRDLERVAALHARLSEPRFRDADRREILERQYDPSQPLQPGKPLPPFDFAALQGDAQRIRSADLRGRVFLVGFWASWCAPCVDEMPRLHGAYAAINDAKAEDEDELRRLGPAEEPRVEFVSVSFDRAREHVEQFRQQQWSMPWTHAYVGAGDYDRVMERYGFASVPTWILVDGDGTILETSTSLRGDWLRPSLERAIAHRSA